MKKHYAYESPFRMKNDDGEEFTLTIEQDEFAENPRDFEGNYCTMVCWHPHYDLGDPHNYKGTSEFFESLYDLIIKNKYDDSMELSWTDKEMTSVDMYKAVCESDDILIKPIRLYDHSGITVSLSNKYPYNDPWDSYYVGFVFITKDYAMRRIVEIEEGNWKETALEHMEAEVKVYDQYLKGEVYEYYLEKDTIHKNTCPHCGQVISESNSTETVDNCGGFYGDCLEENGMIEYLNGYTFVED